MSAYEWQAERWHIDYSCGACSHWSNEALLEIRHKGSMLKRIAPPPFNQIEATTKNYQVTGKINSKLYI